jgi:hypothetical protein
MNDANCCVLVASHGPLAVDWRLTLLIALLLTADGEVVAACFCPHPVNHTIPAATKTIPHFCMLFLLHPINS